MVNLNGTKGEECLDFFRNLKTWKNGRLLSRLVGEVLLLGSIVAFPSYAVEASSAASSAVPTTAPVGSATSVPAAGSTGPTLTPEARKSCILIDFEKSLHKIDGLKSHWDQILLEEKEMEAKCELPILEAADEKDLVFMEYAKWMTSLAKAELEKKQERLCLIRLAPLHQKMNEVEATDKSWIKVRDQLASQFEKCGSARDKVLNKEYSSKDCSMKFPQNEQTLSFIQLHHDKNSSQCLILEEQNSDEEMCPTLSLLEKDKSGKILKKNITLDAESPLQDGSKCCRLSQVRSKKSGNGGFEVLISSEGPEDECDDSSDLVESCYTFQLDGDKLQSKEDCSIPYHEE